MFDPWMAPASVESDDFWRWQLRGAGASRHQIGSIGRLAKSRRVDAFSRTSGDKSHSMNGNRFREDPRCGCVLVVAHHGRRVAREVELFRVGWCLS